MARFRLVDRVPGTARAAGLTFRSTAEGAGYTASIDRAGLVKRWRPRRGTATHAAPITAGRAHRLKVQAHPRVTGQRLRALWCQRFPRLGQGAEPQRRLRWLHASSTADAFHLNDRTGTAFVFEGDLPQGGSG
ncbi:hypothetical protein GCM10022247_53940 [Allokutzneria multivorans]|uniref:Uncharacterized protein n=1 Tax=Allokutzneria multivorans TaxID=1142134 RepID=A0ABP7T9Z8_9PSEU